MFSTAGLVARTGVLHDGVKTMDIVEVEIVSAGPLYVTPLEVLEDFADSVPGWQYLEDDSNFYAEVRGRQGCVLRASGLAETAAPMDYAFADASEGDSSRMRLTVMCPPGSPEVAGGAARDASLQNFLDAFNAYAESRPHVVEIRSIVRHAEGA